MPSAASHSPEPDLEQQLRSIMEDDHVVSHPNAGEQHMDSPSSTPTVASVHDQPFSAITAAMSDSSSSPHSLQPGDSHNELHSHHGWPVSASGQVVQAIMTGPAPTPSIPGSMVPPTCTNCSTSTTPLWRRDAVGAVLCNACGLFLKLHKRPRPISLKTDVIKSRNRIKTARPMPLNPKKKTQTQHPPGFNVTTDPNGLPIVHQVSQKSLHDHDGTGSPVPHYPHNLTHFTDIDGNFPVFSMPGASPGGTTSPHNGDHRGDGTESQESLIATNSTLKTRISELELINELFRGRLAQLEGDSVQARQQLEGFRETEEQLRAELVASHSREVNLKRRLEDVLGIQEPHDGGDGTLKRRFDDSIEGQGPLDLGQLDGHAGADEHMRELNGGDHQSKRFKPNIPENADSVVDPSMQATIDDDVETPVSTMDHSPTESAMKVEASVPEAIATA